MMASTGKKRAKRSPPVRTSREEILETAVQLFLEKGYHGTSTTDICEALGISRPTLYWYFPNKEELLFAAQEEELQKRIVPFIERVQMIDDPLRRLVEFIDEYTRVICSSAAAKVQIKETEYLNAEHRSWVHGVWKNQLDLVRGAIEELQEAGKAKKFPATFAAFSLLGMITWGYTWFDYSRPEGVEGVAQTVKGIFLSGLLAEDSDYC